MVLNTQAANQHGFDTLLPLQALSVHVSWVNCLSSHRRNPGFWCSSLSQGVVRNHTGFWAWSLWMCHPGNRLHLQEWVMSWGIGGWFFGSLLSIRNSSLTKPQRIEKSFVLSSQLLGGHGQGHLLPLSVSLCRVTVHQGSGPPPSLHLHCGWWSLCLCLKYRKTRQSLSVTTVLHF